MATFKLSLNCITATSYAMSSESTRYYLNGIYICPAIDGVRYVATDGHKLIQTEDSLLDTNLPLEFEPFIMPKDTVKKIVQIAKTYGREKIDITIDTESLTVKINNDTFSFKPIDGTFPDYERVKPTQNDDDSLKYIGFNGDYIAYLAKSAKSFTGSKIASLKFHFITPSSPTKITCQDNKWLAVLMPMRVS